MSSVVTANNIVKSYGDFVALNDFSAEFQNGITGLLGPNGAGKTTLIRSFLGIHDIDSGSFDFFEWELPRNINVARDYIGYQPEVPTRIKKTSAMRYVTHMAKLSGLSREAAKQRAFDTLHYVGLEEARYRELQTFSQGMLQKVKLATALVHAPKLLILDEPTAGCDPDAREQILSLIENLGKTYGMNIIVSTHLLPDVERTANNIIVMNHGQKIMQGSLTEIMTNKAAESIYEINTLDKTAAFAELLIAEDLPVVKYSGTAIDCKIEWEDQELRKRIFELAREHHYVIQSMRTKRQSLEEIFLHAVEDE